MYNTILPHSTNINLRSTLNLILLVTLEIGGFLFLQYKVSSYESIK